MTCFLTLMKSMLIGQATILQDLLGKACFEICPDFLTFKTTRMQSISLGRKNIRTSFSILKNEIKQ